MSNPAIVLMTDPSRCSLGDVHHLVQALLEMQQMGEHATPQAFCDHPAAAKDFLAAYVHAYPQLVLQDHGIPTPDHLQSLITSGQVGPFVRPLEAAQGALSRSFEPGGPGGFPIVVLTLGSSQALIDALHQSSAMKESLRVIDIVPDGADALPVSIADAVAIRGLDGELSGEREGRDGGRPELDEVAGAATADPVGVTLRDGGMSLDVVETEDVASKELPAYEQEAAPDHAPVEPASTAAATPAPVAEPPTETARAEASTTVEPVAQAPAPVESTWTVPEPAPLAPVVEEPVVEEEVALDGEEDLEDDDQKDQDVVAEKPPAVEQPDDEELAAGAQGVDDDDDIEYPAVGTLIASADVLYPALEQIALDQFHGDLHELASLLLDDDMVDPELAGTMLAPQPDEIRPAAARPDMGPSERSGDNVVTLGDLYDTVDHDDDPLDLGIARPLHDSDL